MIIWIIGLSGAGKSTLANLLKKKFDEKNKKNIILDGDEVRSHFNHDLGHSLSDRKKNAQRIINFCKLLEKQEVNVIVPILHNFVDQRKSNNKEFKNYFEIYIKAKKQTLFKRDHKKIYSNYTKKKIKNVVGLDLKFNPPEYPNIILKAEDNKFLNLEKVLKLINFNSYYFYDDKDYRKNKTIYAYSNVSDKNFLHGYISKRQKLIKKLTTKKKLIIKSNLKKLSLNQINKYAVKYEKNKILRCQNGEEIELNKYIEISYLFSKLIKEKNYKPLKIINCFLKLNDYISYRLKKNYKDYEYKNLFAKSLINEIETIEAICDEFKIKI